MPARFCLLAVTLVVALTSLGASAQPVGRAAQLAFVPNEGQFNEEVLYRADAQGVAIWLTKSGAVYQFVRVSPTAELAGDATEMAKSTLPSVADLSYESHLMTISFEGADHSRARSDESAGWYANYFIGNQPTAWKQGVPVSASVVYESIYPHIDLTYYAQGQALEYDLIVNPGGDPAQIKLRIDGAESIEITDDGELLCKTPFGTALHKHPFVYQEGKSGRNAITCAYRKIGKRTLTVEVTGDYNRKLPLVVDPEIAFSTFLGGSSYDEGWGVAVDNEGYVYVAGLTASTDFPNEPPMSPASFPVNIFVSKIAPGGNDLIYSTYIGGNDYDGATNIAVDAVGNAYLTGETKSDDFPTVAAAQDTLAGESDALVIKLDKDGNALEYSTYLGGGNYELGRAIAVNLAGEAAIAGHTCSPDFPTHNAYQSQFGGDGGFGHCGDAYIAKFTASGDEIVFSTFLGGESYDEGWGLACDDLGDLYVVGLTASTQFPTENPLYPANVLVDAFLTKVLADGSALVYSTYFGGDNYDGATSVTVDRFYQATVTGETKSTDFPELHETQDGLGGLSDAFVIKFAPDGGALVYSTYIGGSEPELGWDVTVDEFGGATIAGFTLSSDYPLQSPLKGELTGFYDAIVTRIAPSGNLLTFSSYYGGDSDEEARSVAVHNGTSVLLTGSTISTDFPAVNAVQETYGGSGEFWGGDAWAASLVVTYLCGDFDGSGMVNIGDIVILINFIFAGGPAPLDVSGGDVNCEGRPTISDAVYLVNYVFTFGPVPCFDCK